MTTRRCPDPLALSRLVDGELPAPEAQAVREHAAGCSSCRSGLEGLTAASVLGRRAAASGQAAAAAAASGCLTPEELTAYAAQALDGAAVATAEAHLAACDACLVDLDQALRTVAALDADAAPVPETLEARVASRWPAAAEPESITRLVVRVAREGLALLERHLAPPILEVAPTASAAGAYRSQAADTLSFRIKAADAEIRATIVSDGDTVTLTLLLVDRAEANLAGQRIFLRRHGRSLFSARTDEAGELRLPRLERGIYEVACPGIQTEFRLDLRS